MKYGTQYFEGERELSMKVMNNLGLNPYAARLLLRTYMQKCFPKTVSLDYIVDVEGVGVKHLTLEIKKPGHLGNEKAPGESLEEFPLRLFMRSYCESLAPNPVDFLLGGIEFHLREKGVSDFGKKNVARAIFDPTV